MKQLLGLTLGLTLVAVATVRPAAAEETAAQETVAQETVTNESAAKDAAEVSTDSSDADARRALGRWWRFPWYDSTSDDIQPVVVKDRKPVDLPKISVFQILAWIVIAVVLAGLVWLIISALLNYAGFAAGETVGPRIATHVDHTEALPFLRQRSLDDLLGQARQHYLAGNYDEAIIFLFSYQLVELDRRNLIRLSVGKTNRQYLRELHGRGTLAGLVEQTMVAFEDVYFGGRRLTRQRFDGAWDRLPEFEALMASFAPQMQIGPASAVEPVLAELPTGQT